MIKPDSATLQKFKIPLIIITSSLLLLFVFAYFFLNKEDTAITATGMIEVTQADLTAKISGYLVKRDFDEGSEVAKGQIIAQIDKTDYQLQYEQAAAAYQNAVAKLKDLEAGSRSMEIASQAALLNSTRQAMEKATSDYHRFAKLQQDGAISDQELDNYRVAMTTSTGNYQQAQAAYQLSLEGNRIDAITAQRHTVEQMLAAKEYAQNQLEHTNIKSPLNGRVLSKNYEVGEFIQPGAPIATIGDLSNCWVKIYIPSNLLGKIYFDQQAQVRIDSHPGKVFNGQIKEIATKAEFTPRQTITKDERANLVFAIKVYLENPDGIFKPGMPAEVRIP